MDQNFCSVFFLFSLMSKRQFKSFKISSSTLSSFFVDIRILVRAREVKAIVLVFFTNSLESNFQFSFFNSCSNVFLSCIIIIFFFCSRLHRLYNKILNKLLEWAQDDAIEWDSHMNLLCGTFNYNRDKTLRKRDTRHIQFRCIVSPLWSSFFLPHLLQLLKKSKLAFLKLREPEINFCLNFQQQWEIIWICYCWYGWKIP